MKRDQMMHSIKNQDGQKLHRLIIKVLDSSNPSEYFMQSLNCKNSYFSPGDMFPVG